jgi:subtilase family serine protease
VKISTDQAYRLPRSIFALAATLFLLTVAARAAERQVIGSHVPTAVAELNLQPVSRLPATTQLNLAIGLPLRNQEALTNLLQQQYTPSSPQYHHWLTPEQFAAQFGPAEQDYRAVVEFAKSNGFTVTGTHSNRTLLDVRGSVADIEKVFHVNMRVYKHPTEARQFYAPDVEPSIYLAVPILHITGLDNYVMPHSNLRKMHVGLKATNPKPNAGTGPDGCFMGYDFRNAYAPGVPLTGSGQVVGLLELDGYYPSDITTYETQAQLPSVPLRNVLLAGFSGIPGSDNDEVALDIEMAISMAPGLSEVVIYEAPNATPLFGNPYWVDILDEMAYPTQGEPLPKQLSSSWTFGIENDNPTAAQIYQEFALQGQSFFQCSGDFGAYYSGLFGLPWLGIPAWADSPYVTIVGGTEAVEKVVFR